MLFRLTLDLTAECLVICAPAYTQIGFGREIVGVAGYAGAETVREEFVVGADVGDKGVEGAWSIREGSDFREPLGAGCAGEVEEGPRMLERGSSGEELGKTMDDDSWRHCKWYGYGDDCGDDVASCCLSGPAKNCLVKVYRASIIGFVKRFYSVDGANFRSRHDTRSSRLCDKTHG